jgi:hypothetical protein
MIDDFEKELRDKRNVALDNYNLAMKDREKVESVMKSVTDNEEAPVSDKDKIKAINDAVAKVDETRKIFEDADRNLNEFLRLK